MAIKISSNIVIPNSSGDTVCRNLAVGVNALTANATGCYNTAIGYGALAANTTNANTAIGYNALCANTTGSCNVAIGYAAMLITSSAGSITVSQQCSVTGNHAVNPDVT
jgi:hypothetical protein